MRNSRQFIGVSRKRKQLFGVVFCLLLILYPLATVHGQVQDIRIGVLALRGNADAQEHWMPTATYLSEQIPAYHFEIVPLDFDEIYTAVENGDVDFVLANPGIYVELEYKYGVDRIATLKDIWQGDVFDQFGGVIFTLKGRNDLQELADLRGKRFVAVDQDSFGGWRTVYREFLDQGIDPFRDFAEVRFEGTHDKVVYAVLEGEADAGTVRTGILEEMNAEGKINIADLAILNRQFPENFSLLVSTRLYPEWPFARVQHTSDELSQKVSIALLSMPPDDPAAVAAGIYGWTIPYEYQAVHDCFKELRVSPYDTVEPINLHDLLQQYGAWIIAGAIACVILVAVTLHVIQLNRKLNLKTLELKESHEKLEERVAERTLELNQTNERLRDENRVRRQVESELRESEERYRCIYERVLDVIYETDYDGTLIGVSPSIERQSGYRPDELIGKNIAIFFANPAEYQTLTDVIEAAGSVNDFVLRLKRKDGTEVFVSVTASTIFDEDGEPIKIEGVLRDVTDRIHADQAIQTHLMRRDSLRKIDRAIAGSLDLKVTLNVLLEQVIERLEVDAAAVFVYKQELHSLVLTASYGFLGETYQAIKPHLGEGYLGKIALEHKEIFVENLSAEQVRFHFPEDEGFVSYYGVPLIAKGELVGVLEVFQRSPIVPAVEWVDFLYTLAEQAAISIDNLTLFQRLQNSNLKLMRAYDATISGWAQALELRGTEADGHGDRVVDLTLRLARRLGIHDEELVHIRRGALLHDIGEMGVPEYILHKEGALTDEEKEIMHRAPVYAFKWLSPIEYLRPALDIPYSYHEKWDGSGFPRGLQGKQIPLAARIFAVVDMWDKLTSDRPSRKAWSREDAILYLQERSGKDFDRYVVDAFVKYLSEEKMG